MAETQVISMNKRKPADDDDDKDYKILMIKVGKFGSLERQKESKIKTKKYKEINAEQFTSTLKEHWTTVVDKDNLTSVLQVRSCNPVK